MRRIAATILVAGAIVVGLPQTAQAHGDHATWTKPAVCVETSADSSWGVRAAVKAWDAPVHLTVRKDCRRVGIKVAVVNRPDADWAGLAYVWDHPGHITRVRVVLNAGTMSEYGRCHRQHVTSHELGHALGLPHYMNRPQSVMSYDDTVWERCGEPSDFDRRTLRRAYR